MPCEFESLLPGGDRNPSVQRAEERLEESRAKAAMLRCGEWIKQGLDLRHAGRWEEVGGCLSRTEEAVAKHSLRLTEAQQSQIASLRDYFLERHDDFQKQTAFEAALRELLTDAELIESECQASGVSALPRLAGSLARLNRGWQKVESFGRPVEGETIQRVKRLVEFLRTEIARGQRKRLITVSVAVLASMALVSATGWWLVGMYRAGECAKEIAAAMEGGLVEGVERLVASAQERGLTRFSPSLERQIEAGRAWIVEKGGDLGLATQALESLEAIVAAEFAGTDPVSLRETEKAVHDAISALPKEQQGGLRQRLTATTEPIQTYVRLQGAGAVEEMREQVAHFETTLLAPLKSMQDIETFAGNLETAERSAATWSHNVRPDLPEFALPPALRASAEAMQGTLASLRAQFDELTTHIEAMKSAVTIEDYKLALGKAAESPLLQIEEVQKMRTAAALPPDPELMLAELLLPWQPDAWNAVKQGGEPAELHPTEILPSEDSSIEAIANDEFTKNIYMARLEGTPNRVIYTKDTPLQEGDTEEYVSYEWRKFRTFSGSSVYDPEVDGPLIRFRPRNFAANKRGEDRATSAGQKGPAPFTRIAETMRILDMIRNTKVVISAWEMLDRANGAGVQCPVYQAFVAHHMGRMTSIRPLAWGGHFCPSGMEFLNGIRKASSGRSFRSGDWLRPAQDETLLKKIREVLPEKSYFLQEARMNRSLAMAANVAGGLQYAGFIGPDGTAVARTPAAGADSLWGMAGGAGQQKAAKLFQAKDAGNGISLHGIVLFLR